MFECIHHIINPSIILIIFSDLLAHIYYYDTWRIVTIKVAIGVFLLVGSSLWWRFLQKYNNIVKP